MTSKNNEKETIAKSNDTTSNIGLLHTEKYLVKTKFAQQISGFSKKRGLEQAEAAVILEVGQSKISSLNCGHVNDFSIERLISFLNKLDRDVEIIVKKRPTQRKLMVISKQPSVKKLNAQ